MAGLAYGYFRLHDAYHDDMMAGSAVRQTLLDLGRLHLSSTVYGADADGVAL